MGSSPSVDRPRYVVGNQQVLGQCYDQEDKPKGPIRVAPYQGDDEKDGLFSFGDGTHGKLGHGTEVQCILPTLVTGLAQRTIVHVAAGLNHSLILSDQSEVFSFGWNAYGQLGQGNRQDLHGPNLILFFDDKHASSCTAGDNHSLVLCEDGLYSFGWGHYGQLGHGNKSNQTIPKRIQFFTGKTVELYAAGAAHTLVVCSDGQLYSFGDGRSLQLGHPERCRAVTPRPVAFFSGKKIDLIAAGAAHSVVACSNGLYTFGAGGQGQLGFGFIPNSPPRPVEAFTDMASGAIHYVACGSSHTLVLTSDGLFSFGDGKRGQLGHSIEKAQQGTPQRVEFFAKHKISAISCRNEHVLVMTNKGIFGFGSSEEGQLGSDNLKSNNDPNAIPFFQDQNVTCFAAGGAHSLVVAYPATTADSIQGTAVPSLETIRQQIMDYQTSFAAAPTFGVAGLDHTGHDMRRTSSDFAKQLEGDDLKNWTKQCLLGQGSSGRVYLGILTGRLVGHFVAVKVIELGTLTNQKQVEKLAVEISLMREYQHPNIVQYYGCEVSKADNVLNILMEYTPGGSISSLIAKSPAGRIEDPALLKHFTRQILLGLAYLHENGVIHRDIKGDNILVTETGSVKLADFGCSKRIGELASASRNGADTFVGTPFWMAPEVITDEQVGYGVKADIWSLGCTMVEMLTGKPPWQEFKTMWSAIYHIANSTGKPSGIPDNLAPLLAKFLDLCLERDVERRPSAMELLQHPFLSTASPTGTPTTSPERLPPLVPPTYRHQLSRESNKSGRETICGLLGGLPSITP